MQIKSFKAPTLKEAMANVKSELGVDAVILHTNKIKKGGILGFHAKEIVEVIAAIEDEPVVKEQKPAMDTGAASEAVLQAAAAARASRNSAPEPQPTGNFTPRNMVSQYQTAGTIEAISHAMAQNTPSPTFGEVLASVNRAQEQAESEESASGILPQQLSDQPVVNEQVAPVQPAVDVNSGVEQPVVKEELAEPMKAAPESLSQDRDTVMASEDATDLDVKEQEILDLQNQLEEMKSMLVEMSRNKDEAGGIPNLQRAMEAQGISQHVLEDMISKLNGTEILAPQNSIKALKALEKYVRKSIRIANGITLYSDKPKIVALIGPTGVGKTTTLAKIAAKFVLEEGAKVALITADTYRISAVEQLKTYSDILGLPLEIVYNPQALQEAIEKHRDKQLILLDTAGRSQYNAYQMKELSELLNIDADIEKHLVMSATTKTSDGLELLDNFSLCKPDRVIFTKVDETKTHGIILNILHRRKAALSYLTNGQSVPDDIEPASIEKLAELLLR
ncbi:MAG: flagellar biosynthesis protein FlhF [Anaerovibrio sp.]